MIPVQLDVKFLWLGNIAQQENLSLLYNQLCKRTWLAKIIRDFFSKTYLQRSQARESAWLSLGIHYLCRSYYEQSLLYISSDIDIDFCQSGCNNLKIVINVLAVRNNWISLVGVHKHAPLQSQTSLITDDIWNPIMLILSTEQFSSMGLDIMIREILIWSACENCKIQLHQRPSIHW